MTSDIETYLNSLSVDIDKLYISNRNITSLPDLTRFKKLEVLYCCENSLTSLPTLPKSLKKLHCCVNELTSLLPLPQSLEELLCCDNELTSLPTLSQSLAILDCYNNKLTSLPTLPQSLKKLVCAKNKLTSLPNLPQKLEELYCHSNPIFEIIHNDMLLIKKQNIQTLNNFRHLYYCLQFKKQLKKWLWEKVREPKIKKMYSPMYLIEKLGDGDDLDTVLNSWIKNNR